MNSDPVLTAGMRRLVSPSDVKEFAGVGRPTVSNWRRRFATGPEAFPQPVAGTSARPLFDAEQVARWLDGRPLPDAVAGAEEVTYGARFRRRLRTAGLFALRHEVSDGDSLLLGALSTLASQASETRLPEDESGSVPEGVRHTALELADALGGPGAAAEEVVAGASRLGASLLVDTAPSELCELLGALIGHDGRLPGSVLALHAGAGEVLAATGLLMQGGTAVWAVEQREKQGTLLGLRVRAHRSTDIRVEAEEPEEGVRFETVVTTPPYDPGEKDGQEVLQAAFQVLKRLEPGGYGYLALPAWVFAKTRRQDPALARQRQRLLTTGAVASLVQLPRRTHRFRTGAETCLLVLRRPGSSERQPAASVLLVDADRVARRVSRDHWHVQVAEMVRTDASPRPGEARRFAVAAQGRSETLLDGRSLLPAHRLAGHEPDIDHYEATLDARRTVSATMPSLQSWVAGLGVIRHEGRAYERVGALIDAQQLLLRPGHRIRAEHVGDAGLPLVGRDELLGIRPIGERRVLEEDLAAYSSSAVTEKGDVLLLTDDGVTAVVDETGGSVVLTPVRSVRIAAWRDHLEGKIPDVWMRPRALAALLAASRNQRRGAGAWARRASLHELDLPKLSPGETAELENVLEQAHRHAEELRRRLDAVEDLAVQLAAGVADGDLALRATPRHGSGP